jgi:hypothetical protein
MTNVSQWLMSSLRLQVMTKVTLDVVKTMNRIIGVLQQSSSCCFADQYGGFFFPLFFFWLCASLMSRLALDIMSLQRLGVIDIF